MKNFDSRTYSINDFREWDARKELQLQPKFQRRSVWNDKARSYLIDSIIRGKPIPKIFIRQDINPKTKATLREVVDGQQRLRTIFSFLQNGFIINKAHSDKFGGAFYSDLPVDVQTTILKYEISVDLLLDAPDKEVLDIFARLNSYAVKLNPQELRNATYFGEFKTLAYSLALEYISFWKSNKIFTDPQILRMAEAELTSDLLVAALDGIRSRKALDSYYKRFDDEIKDKPKLTRNFRNTMDVIGTMSCGAFSSSPFTSPVLFYSLFCAVYHHLHGLPGCKLSRKRIKSADFPRIWNSLESIPAIISNNAPVGKEAAFIDSLKRHTTDESVRESRSKFLIQLIAKSV